MALTIVQIGHPVLRQTARELSREEILGESVQTLIAQMRSTMHASQGVGLAAPQIGEPLQLAVIEDTADRMAHLSAEDCRARERTLVPFQVLINPQLRVLNPDQRLFFEGCLSATGLVGCVARAAAVRVACLNERAEPVTFDAHGWHARIVQHEVDHLNGRLYFDRAALPTLMTVENFNAHWSSETPVGVCRALGATT